jgi:hypothetical protein
MDAFRHSRPMVWKSFNASLPWPGFRSFTLYFCRMRTFFLEEQQPIIEIEGETAVCGPGTEEPCATNTRSAQVKPHRCPWVRVFLWFLSACGDCTGPLIASFYVVCVDSDYAEEQRGELEALESIFGGDLKGPYNLTLLPVAYPIFPANGCLVTQS